MTALLALVGLLAAMAVGWRQVARRAPFAARALGIGVGAAAVVVAYPGWFGLFGPESVSGVLFTIAPIAGVFLSGYLAPGAYGELATAYVRFGGYFGRIGPPPNFVGWGIGLGTVASVVLARRRPIVWFLVFLAAITFWLSLGSYLLGHPPGLAHLWLPWRYLSKLPVLQEILPDQFAPFGALCLAFLLALGLDALYRTLRSSSGWRRSRIRWAMELVTVVVGVAALVPVFVTFDMPFTVRPTNIPFWVSHDALRLPTQTVLLTVPFAVSGSTAPMLWQAVDAMHFSLAGGGLKTPNASGGPVGQGAPGSARRILYDLSLLGDHEPKGTPGQYAAVRQAVRRWDVDEVVIDGESRDPVYASGYLTAALGVAPTIDHLAWVWKIPPSGLRPAVTNTSLLLCRAAAIGSSPRDQPLKMSRCVLQNTKRS